MSPKAAIPCLWDTLATSTMKFSLPKSLFVIATACVTLLVCFFRATAANHIEVTHEIFLESGEPPLPGNANAFPVNPTALVQTHDGGYVIAGSLGMAHRAWAVRVDATGKVQWQHTVHGTSDRTWEVNYEGAALFPDDSAILCGYKAIDDGNIVGLVTHIDKFGQVIREEMIYPRGDNNYQLTYFRRCESAGDEVKIFGTTQGTTQFERMSYWTVVLDMQGKIKSENLVGIPIGTNLDYDKANRVVDSKTGTISQLGLREMPRPYVYPQKAYYMSDRSLALFGSSNAVSAIAWFSPDLKEHDVWRASHPNSSVWIADAVPTGKPREFATIREVHPTKSILGFDGETRTGVVLGFVQFK